MVLHYRCSASFVCSGKTGLTPSTTKFAFKTSVSILQTGKHISASKLGNVVLELKILESGPVTVTVNKTPIWLEQDAGHYRLTFCETTVTSSSCHPGEQLSDQATQDGFPVFRSVHSEKSTLHDIKQI